MERVELGDLVRAARRGERAAQERLFLCLFRDLRPLARRLASREVDDVLAEMGVRVLESLGRLEEDEQILSFAVAVLRNVAREGWRAERKFSAVQHLPERFRLNGGLSAVETEDLIAFIERKLQDEERDLFRSWRLHGFSVRGVAEETSIAVNAVACRIYRLRQKLKALLGEYELGGWTG